MQLEAQVLGGEAEASRLASQVQQLQLEAVMLKRDLDSERQARKQETSHLRTQCELQVCLILKCNGSKRRNLFTCALPVSFCITLTG